MPGMMDTILNLGLNDESVAGLVKKTGNERFVWDSYRRFVQMYGDVVLGMKPVSKEDEDPFEEIIDHLKEEKGVKLDHKLVREFEPEMGRIHVARISGADGDRGKIERVRVYGGDNRDHYGSKLN